jgi:hypothetical protein
MGRCGNRQGPKDVHRVVNALMALLDDGDIVGLPVSGFDPENFTPNSMAN